MYSRILKYLTLLGALTVFLFGGLWGMEAQSQESGLVDLEELLPRAMNILDDDYSFKVGDQIIYQVVEDGDDPVQRVVMDTGEVNLPYIGKVKAQGLTARQLAYKLKPLLEKEYYNEATVLIALDTQRKFKGKVYIFGAVSAPGSVQIPTDEVFTVSRAILKAGGFAPSADRTSVRIERQKPDGKESMMVNMAKVIDEGDSENDLKILPNDFIVVPNQSSRGRVFVTGEVMRPGPIPLPAETPLMVSDAILSAGGFQEFADKGKVRVIRKTGEKPSDTRELIVDVAAVLEKGIMEEDLELQADDRVIVRQRWINF